MYFYHHLSHFHRSGLEEYQRNEAGTIGERNDQVLLLLDLITGDTQKYIITFSQEDQLKKRLQEERRWFLQSCLILLGFLVSLAPIFIFYLLSLTSSIQLHPAFNLLSWLLFFSGASYNFLIYNFLNPQFRKKFSQVFYHKREGSTRTRSTFLSKSSGRKVKNPPCEKIECEAMINGKPVNENEANQ